MSTTFKDGPAKQSSLLLQRAPAYMRVVVSAAGEVDALDDLLDEPEEGETLYAYRRVSSRGYVHVCGRNKGKRFSGYYVFADYAMVENQPSQDVMRDADKWREWATEEFNNNAKSKAAAADAPKGEPDQGREGEGEVGQK